MYRWLLSLATAGFVMAGLLKGSGLFSALPVDLTLGLAAVTAIGVLAEAVRSGVPRAVHGAVAAFALLLPAALLAAGTEYAADKTMKLFSFTLLALLAPIVLIRTRRDAERHLLAWTVVAGIIVASALINPVEGGDYAGAPVTAAGTDTIDLGLAAGLVLIVLVLGMLWKRVPWLIGLPAGGVAVYVLLQSGSRGPLISAVLGIGLAALLVRVRPTAGRSAAVAVLAAGGLVLAFQAAPYYSQLRITQLLFEGQLEGSASTRLRLFDVAWTSIIHEPLGLGLGGFQEIAFLGYRYPHNLPLEVLAEAGVVLGGLFLVWIVVQFWRIRTVTTDFAGGATFALLVFMLGAAAVTGDLNENRILFHIIGIGIALWAMGAADRPRGIGRVGRPDTHQVPQRVADDVAR